MNACVKKMLGDMHCTGINSIVYADGTMVLFNVGFDADGQRAIWPIVDAQIESFLKYNADDLAPFDIFAQATWQDFTVRVGDSSAEGSGIICVQRADNEELLWFLCFENSEPFTSVSVEDGVIFATSDVKEVWRLDIRKPLDI
jgi:hypothetical protein